MAALWEEETTLEYLLVLSESVSIQKQELNMLKAAEPADGAASVHILHFTLCTGEQQAGEEDADDWIHGCGCRWLWFTLHTV